MTATTTSGDVRPGRVTSRWVRAWSRIAGAVVLLVASGAFAGDPVAPAPAAAAPLTKEQTDSLARLKVRVAEWMSTRGRLVHIEGGVRSFDGNVGRKVLYEMRSPTWRKRDTSRDEATAEFRTWRLADAWKIAPRKFKYTRGELVDARHALAFVIEGLDNVARTSRWVLDAEDGKKPDWFLWMEAGDGPWPTSNQAPAAAPNEGDCDEVPEIQGLAIDALLEKSGMKAKVDGKSRCGRTLVIALTYREDATGVESLVEGDAIAAFRAVFGSQAQEWDRIRLEFQGMWQDRFGEREQSVWWTVGLDSETFAKIRWANLTPAQAFALFDSKRESAREGWALVHPK